jgi:hypothetical protein
MIPSLCDTCRNVREVRTPRSRFLLCELSLMTAAYPKYPPQPVVRCDGYRPRNDADEGRVIGLQADHGWGEMGKVRHKMLPLYEEPHFTFRFADDRIIPRFHLEGVGAGRRVAVYKIDPDSGERRALLATAGVGDGGWVDLQEPITVRAGEAFIAVPEEAGGGT